MGINWKDREARNKYQREYLRERYKRQRAQAIEFLGAKCESCGTTEELQFDHEIIGLRKKHIGDVVGRWNMDRVIQLLKDDKIRLLCRSCHIKRHREDACV